MGAKRFELCRDEDIGLNEWLGRNAAPMGYETSTKRNDHKGYVASPKGRNKNQSASEQIRCKPGSLWSGSAGLGVLLEALEEMTNVRFGSEAALTSVLVPARSGHRIQAE